LGGGRGELPACARGPGAPQDRDAGDAPGLRELAERPSLPPGAPVGGGQRGSGNRGGSRRPGDVRAVAPRRREGRDELSLSCGGGCAHRFRATTGLIPPVAISPLATF